MVKRDVAASCRDASKKQERRAMRDGPSVAEYEFKKG
jgi:hypothetical protein